MIAARRDVVWISACISRYDWRTGTRWFVRPRRGMAEGSDEGEEGSIMEE